MSTAREHIQDATNKYLEQTDHGFVVGDVLRRTLGGYAKAKADTPENAEVCGMVMSVIDENKFRMAIDGHVSGVTDYEDNVLTDRTVYWLSTSVSGKITAEEPITAGMVGKPVFLATSSTEGVFVNMRGCIIPEGTIAPGVVIKPVYHVALTRGSNNDYTGTIDDYSDTYHTSPIYIFTTDSGNDVNGVEARVNINDIGWVNLRKRDVPQGASTKLGYYDMSPAGQLAFVYDGTEFQLMTPERKFTFSGQAYYEAGDSYTVRRVVISDHPTSYVNGYVYNIIFTDASPSSYSISTDEVSLKVNGLDPMVIKKRDSALDEFVKIDNAELKTGRLYQFVCNGTNMILVTPTQKQCYFATSKDTRSDLIDVDIRDYPSAYNGDSFILVQTPLPKTGTPGQNLVAFKINGLAEHPIMYGVSEYAGEDDFVAGGETLLKYNSANGIWCLVGHAISGKLATNMCDIRLSINGSDNPDDISDSGVPSRVVMAHRYKGDKIALWNLASSRWIAMRVPTQFGNWINPVDTPDTIIADISVYYDWQNNVVQLMTSAIWADMHTRTEALEVLNGVLVFAGMPDRRYLGTISMSMDNAILLDPDDIVDYLSGGNEEGTTPEEAFDGNSGTYWGSIQEGSEVSGNAFVGYSLGGGYDSIREIIITQDDVEHAIDSVKVYSIDPDYTTTWTDHGTYAITKDGSPSTILITEWCANRQFKIVAAANPDDGAPGAQTGDNPWMSNCKADYAVGGQPSSGLRSPNPPGMGGIYADNGWGFVPQNASDGNPESSWSSSTLYHPNPITDDAYIAHCASLYADTSIGVDIKNIVVKHDIHDTTCPSVEVISYYADEGGFLPNGTNVTSHGTFAMDPDDTETLIALSTPIAYPSDLDEGEYFWVALLAKAETVLGTWRVKALLFYEFDAPFDPQDDFIPAHHNWIAPPTYLSNSGCDGDPASIGAIYPHDRTFWTAGRYCQNESAISAYVPLYDANATFGDIHAEEHGWYIGIDMGSGNTIAPSKVGLGLLGTYLGPESLWGSGDPTGMRDYDLEYSDDGSAWTRHCSLHVAPPYPLIGPYDSADPTAWSNATTICYISSPPAKRFWRVTVPSCSTNFGRPWCVNAFNFYEYEAATGTPPPGGGYEPVPVTWRVQDIQIKTVMGACWTEEKRHLWNYYNQSPVKLRRKIDASDIVCSTNSFVCLGNEMYNTGTASGMRVDYVIGALNSQMSIEATLLNIADSGNSYEGGHVGIGFNAVSASNVENISDVDGCNPTVSGLQRYNQITARYVGQSPHGTIGLNSLNAIVRTNNSSAETTFNCGDNSGGLIGWLSA